MIVGIGKDDVYAYVLEEDRQLPSEQQTVFYIKPKTGEDANKQTKEYLRSLRNKDDGTTEMDVDKANKADIANFKISVKKVENYAFPQKWYEEREGLRKGAKEVELDDGTKVFVTPVIDDDYMLAEVQKTLSRKHLKEISEASESVSKLKEGQKK